MIDGARREPCKGGGFNALGRDAVGAGGLDVCVRQRGFECVEQAQIKCATAADDNLRGVGAGAVDFCGNAAHGERAQSGLHVGGFDGVEAF